jgi:hypothetical protein
VPPPDTHVGIAPPAIIHTRAHPATVARPRMIPPAVARIPAAPRAPRVLAEPDRLPVLARAHGAILEIGYKIVNKVREQATAFPGTTGVPPTPGLSCLISASS